MGELLHMRRRPRGCDPVPQADRAADVEADRAMLLSAARAVLDARSETQRSLAIARLGHTVAAIDRGWVA